MSKITIGSYVNVDSYVHRVNPQIKLIINILFIVTVFLINSFLTLGILFLSIFVTFCFSKLQFRKLFSLLKPVFLIGIFIFLINIFIVKDNSNDFEVWKTIKWKMITISYSILKQSLLVMIRIYIMILITTLLTSTTKSIDLTRAIEFFLLPLKIIKFPVHIIAMIISIALRFIPTLLEESQRIMKAQASRGVDFKNGNIKTKTKATITLIIPLFISAFTKAEDLSNAMEVRGYDPYAKRTKYRKNQVKLSDIIIFCVFVGIITLAFLLKYNIVFVPDWWNI